MIQKYNSHGQITASKPPLPPLQITGLNSDKQSVKGDS